MFFSPHFKFDVPLNKKEKGRPPSPVATNTSTPPGRVRATPGVDDWWFSSSQNTRCSPDLSLDSSLGTWNLLANTRKLGKGVIFRPWKILSAPLPFAFFFSVCSKRLNFFSFSLFYFGLIKPYFCVRASMMVILIVIIDMGLFLACSEMVCKSQWTLTVFDGLIGH